MHNVTHCGWEAAAVFGPRLQPEGVSWCDVNVNVNNLLAISMMRAKRPTHLSRKTTLSPVRHMACLQGRHPMAVCGNRGEGCCVESVVLMRTGQSISLHMRVCGFH